MVYEFELWSLSFRISIYRTGHLSRGRSSQGKHSQVDAGVVVRAKENSCSTVTEEQCWQQNGTTRLSRGSQTIREYGLHEKTANTNISIKLSAIT